MKLINMVIALSTILFLMIGVDKFIPFLEPRCSLADEISPWVWKAFGILQLLAAALIWAPKFRKPIAGFFFAFMLGFITLHLWVGTYDIGGAMFMTFAMGLLLWNPAILNEAPNAEKKN